MQAVHNQFHNNDDTVAEKPAPMCFLMLSNVKLNSKDIQTHQHQRCTRGCRDPPWKLMYRSNFHYSWIRSTALSGPE